MFRLIKCLEITVSLPKKNAEATADNRPSISGESIFSSNGFPTEIIPASKIDRHIQGILRHEISSPRNILAVSTVKMGCNFSRMDTIPESVLDRAKQSRGEPRAPENRPITNNQNLFSRNCWYSLLIVSLWITKINIDATR